MSRAIALVESATQLLNAVEWAHATGARDELHIVVLAPRDKQTVRQIGAVRDVVATAGVPTTVLPVRVPGAAGAAALGRMVNAVARAEELIIGDPFSRCIQTVLPASRAEHVVVVDDGTATWEYAARVNAGTPLVRWQLTDSGPQHRARRATRLLSPSLGRALTVFSCLDDATPVGATSLRNRYAWTRSWCAPQVVDHEVDVLGASLVDTGVVQREDYLAAITRLARRYAPVRYIAHRRESDLLVAQVATIPGVRVLRADLPVELALRRGPVGRTVITFPSTAAHTLPIVLDDVDVRVDVRHIDPAWFTGSTTTHAREFVDRIAASAPVRPVLEIA